MPSLENWDGGLKITCMYMCWCGCVQLMAVLFSRVHSGIGMSPRHTSSLHISTNTIEPCIYRPYITCTCIHCCDNDQGIEAVIELAQRRKSTDTHPPLLFHTSISHIGTIIKPIPEYMYIYMYMCRYIQCTCTHACTCILCICMPNLEFLEYFWIIR